MSIDSPAVVGVVIAVPSFILGYLGYRRSVHVDATTQQSAIASNQIGAVGQVIDGLNKLVASLQSDNTALRMDVIDLRKRLQDLEERWYELENKFRSLRDKSD